MRDHRNTWVDPIGTLLAVSVSAIVAVSLVFGMLAFWNELRPKLPQPALAVPDAAKGLEPPPADLAVGGHHRATPPIEPLTLEAPAEDSLQVDMRPGGVEVPIHLVSP